MTEVSYKKNKRITLVIAALIRPALLRTRLYSIAAIVAAVAGCSISSSAQNLYGTDGFYIPQGTKYGSSKPSKIEITMEDGIKLIGVSYYPTLSDGSIVNEKFPVIIEMTPYPDRGAQATHIANFNKHGYIFLTVRPRGTGGSEGEVQQFNSRDGMDGKNVAYWAAKNLKGTNGSVGLFGCSYPGAIALAAAAVIDKTSPIKAVISACIGFDMQFRQVWSTNGLPNAALTAFAPNSKFIMGDIPSNSYWDNFYQGIMSGGPEAYDGYWKDRLPLTWAKNIVENNIPVLLWGGWKDINEIGAVHAYTAFQNAVNGKKVYEPMSKDMPVSNKYQLIMGGWGHGEGMEALIYIEWFDTWIKHVKTGFTTTKNPLHIYEDGSGRWINTDRYPLVNEYQSYYLNSGKTLSTTRSNQSGSESLSWGKPSQKDGKIEFSTPVFPNGITLAGPMSVTLYASSSNTNLAFIGRLFDVSPTGDSVRINYGGILGSQSELDDDWSWKDSNGVMIWPWPKLDKDRYLTPNKVTRVDLSLATRQYAVKPGHKLVLQITSQSPENICPDKGQAPFVAEPCGLTKPQQETLPGGQYKIHFSSQYPTALNLPVLPYMHFKEVPSGLPSLESSPASSYSMSGRMSLPVSWE